MDFLIDLLNDLPWADIGTFLLGVGSTLSGYAAYKATKRFTSNHNGGDDVIDDRATVDEDTQEFSLFADEREERVVDPEKVPEPQVEPQTAPDPDPEPGPVTTPDEEGDDDGEDDTA